MNFQPKLARRALWKAGFAALALGLTACSSAAPAQRVGSLADVSVLDRDTGERLEIIRHGGEAWIAGRPGARYAIVVRNRTGARVLAVTAVDGVNVVSGETAAWSQTGYVFGAQQGYEITGWRKSQGEVAAFTFTALPDAYASRTGRPAHVGVIGVALFRERMAAVTLPYPASAAREAAGSLADAAPAPAAPAAASPMHERRADAKLGTGHGPREVSQVAQTAFERRASEPDEVIRIRYDSRDNLIALGVLPREGAPRPPNPFPDSPAVSRYVPDPPPRY